MSLTLARFTSTQQALAGIGVSVAMPVCFHLFWVAPTRADIARQQQTLAGLRREIARAAATERALPELRRSRDALSTRLAVLRQAAPPELEARGVLRDVQTIAEDAGVWITRLTPSPAVARDAVSEWSVTLEFEGTYAGLMQFLRGLADAPRLVTVAGLRLRTPGVPDDGITVTGSCRLTTFVRRDAPHTPAVSTGGRGADHPAEGEASGTDQPGDRAEDLP